MKYLYALLVAVAFLAESQAQEVKRNIPYADKADERQVLDVYSPKDAKDLPVVFWIHGGGWQTGDKTDVQIKPQAFMDRGFVFVSTNYRLLPSVDMATIVRDVAKSIRWVHDHIAAHGGDPKRLLIMGHSAGAQLAALICTDDRYLQAEGLSLAIVKVCVPVDGDTYDVPAIIETAEARWRSHGLPRAKFGHREKFGNDPAKHRDFSAVTHVAKDKGIPPFFILHVAGHPDVTAQAQRLGNVMKDVSLPVTVFAARETTHSKINADLGKPDDPATKALFEFLEKAMKAPETKAIPDNAETGVDVQLSRALTLHASFDKGLDADFCRSDKSCYVQQRQSLVAAKPNQEVKLAADVGRFGGALHFPKKGAYRPAFKDGGVLGYNAKSWSASVSVWLRLNPDKDLEPGYCDPIQIIGDDTKKGFIFLEWSKDETPRYFRYAIRPVLHIWNPTNVAWDNIPVEKRPMVQVARAPFSREQWTHVVFTLENVNDKSQPPRGKLYLNGKQQGAIEKWDLTLDWDPARVLLVLGAAYVGYMDDLAVFDRALTDAEVERVHGLKNGIRDLYPAKP